VAEEKAAEQGGVHLLQTGAVGKRPLIERLISPVSHCWDKGHMSTSHRQLYLMHIPKTAACSIIKDLAPTFGRGNIYSDEKCYSLRSEHNFTGVMTVLRSPRPHVLSQFFECATSDDWVLESGSRARVPKRFEDYVTAWAQWHQQGNVSGSWSYFNDPFTCYRPVSLQAQRYTCSDAHEYPKSIDVTGAISNMLDTEYVGIAEAYQESVCLFYAKLFGTLPAYCDCSNAEAWGSFPHAQETHGERPHSIEDYSEATVADIDSITFADRELYKAGVERFQKDIREVEKQFGTKVMCKDLKQDPTLQYVLAPLAA